MKTLRTRTIVMATFYILLVVCFTAFLIFCATYQGNAQWPDPTAVMPTTAPEETCENHGLTLQDGCFPIKAYIPMVMK